MQLYTYSAISKADLTLIQTTQQIGQLWTTELTKGNIRPIVDSYGEGFQCYVPHAGLLDNKQAVAAAWQQAVDSGLRHVAIEALDVTSEGGLGYEVGTYIILNDQGAATENGHYLLIWRLENGQWKWHRHMWNYHFRAES